MDVSREDIIPPVQDSAVLTVRFFRINISLILSMINLPPGHVTPCMDIYFAMMWSKRDNYTSGSLNKLHQ